MNDTQLIFVVGSGRCGTKLIKKLLAGTDIEARHEYMRNVYQRDAMLYHLGKLAHGVMATTLFRVYAPAAHYSEYPVFLDSSHKLSWCVDVLAETFPQAKFVHLVRDGRKVVESFFYKLNIFDDHGAKVLRDWMDKRDFQIPPLEENYWQVEYNNPDKFERICHHWVKSNWSIIEGLPEGRGIEIKLENLVSSKYEMTRFLNFCGVKYADSFMETAQRPDHVYVPINYNMTDEQRKTFYTICGSTMEYFNYIGEEYNVNY